MFTSLSWGCSWITSTLNHHLDKRLALKKKKQNKTKQKTKTNHPPKKQKQKQNKTKQGPHMDSDFTPLRQNESLRFMDRGRMEGNEV